MSVVIYVLQRFPGDVLLKPDSEVFVENFKKKRHMVPSGIHIELRAGIGELCKGRNVSVMRVPAHFKSDEAYARGVSLLDWAGNYWADKLADRGADIHEISEGDMKMISMLDARSVLIMKRLFAINVFVCVRN